MAAGDAGMVADPGSAERPPAGALQGWLAQKVPKVAHLDPEEAAAILAANLPIGLAEAVAHDAALAALQAYRAHGG